MNRKNLLYLLGVGAVTFILMIAIASAWIGYTVESTCQRARKYYKADECVTALIAQVNDGTQSFEERNDAVWALGQYGDDRALPTLEQHYTGNIPDREPWNETLSQYELQKAINLLKGEFNITVIFRSLTLDREKN